VGVVLKALQEVLDVLVEHRWLVICCVQDCSLLVIGQLAEQNQVGRFEGKFAVFGQLFRREPEEQLAFVAVDVGDGACGSSPCEGTPGRTSFMPSPARRP